jgi:hypothetical protein
MPAEQRVSAREVLASAGANAPVKGGTFLQRTGLILAACVGALGSLVILLLVGKWMCSAPTTPAIPPGADSNTVKAILDNYKTLQQITLEPYTTLFDSIVVKVLLPVFTSILGYIFGSRTAAKEE